MKKTTYSQKIQKLVRKYTLNEKNKSQVLKDLADNLSSIVLADDELLFGKHLNANAQLINIRVEPDSIKLDFGIPFPEAEELDEEFTKHNPEDMPLVESATDKVINTIEIRFIK